MLPIVTIQLDREVTNATASQSIARMCWLDSCREDSRPGPERIVSHLFERCSADHLSELRQLPSSRRDRPYVPALLRAGASLGSGNPGTGGCGNHAALAFGRSSRYFLQ